MIYALKVEVDHTFRNEEPNGAQLKIGGASFNLILSRLQDTIRSCNIAYVYLDNEFLFSNLFPSETSFRKIV